MKSTELRQGMINSDGVYTHIQNYRKFKFKDKRYARPLILDFKQYAATVQFEFERLNPGKSYKEFFEDI